MVPFPSFAMPKLPAVKRVRPPPVSLLLTVKLVSALIVRDITDGWQGPGKRQQQKLEHFQYNRGQMSKGK